MGNRIHMRFEFYCTNRTLQTGDWLTDLLTGVIALVGVGQIIVLLFYQLGLQDVHCPLLAATIQEANIL